MKKSEVFVHGQRAGLITETEPRRAYQFEYVPDYAGAPVSLTMPVAGRLYFYDRFPPFFEGLLPEGIMLEGLLQGLKLDRDDFMGQLAATGEDLVGAVTVKPVQLP
jgi:serine/threonine-protein kinase HipA